MGEEKVVRGSRIFVITRRPLCRCNCEICHSGHHCSVRSNGCEM